MFIPDHLLSGKPSVFQQLQEMLCVSNFHSNRKRVVHVLGIFPGSCSTVFFVVVYLVLNCGTVVMQGCANEVCAILHCSLLFLCSAASGSISTSNEHWTEALHWSSAEHISFSPSPSFPPSLFPKTKTIEMLIFSDS